MKKILMVCFVFPPRFSGAAFQALSLAKALSKRGVKCDFFVANYQDNSFWLQSQEYGCNFYRVRQGVFFPLALFFFLILKRKDYSAIHFHGISNIHFLCVYISKLFKLKVIQKLTTGNDDKNELNRPGKLKIFRKIAYKITDKFVAISTALENGLREQGIPDHKIYMIPNGVDLDVYKPFPSMKNEMRKQFGYEPQDYILIFVGTIRPIKNIMTLLRASEIALKKLENISVKFILAGPFTDAEYYEELTKYIKTKGLVDCVSFLGQVDSQTISKLNALADVMVFAGMSEGCPNVLIEGKCSGLPLIAIRSGGVEDVVNHANDGYLIEPDDLNAFADSIVKLHDEKIRCQFFEAGRKDCMATYSFDKIASQYIKSIYNFS
jgi:glycosyltransferase involved in cell wall biosynthesis